MADYRAMAAREARRYGLDPHIFIRQIKQESGFNPNARSPMGATGIAQIMPDTAKAWGVNPNDPKAALRAAAKNMAQYVKKYGSYENALRAYNAGPAAIEKSKGYDETNHYVQTILRGRDPKRLGSRSSGGGGGEGTAGFGIPGTPLSQEYTPGAERVLSDVGGDNSGLLQALIGQQAAPPPISGPPRLAVTAQSLMPEGYIPPASGAAPVQRPDIGALIEATRGLDGGGIDRAAPGSLEVTPGTGGQWVPGSPGEGGSGGSDGPSSAGLRKAKPAKTLGVKPHVAQSAGYLMEKYGVKQAGGYRANDPFPDHPSRKAVDFMVGNNEAGHRKGDALVRELTKNHREHKVKYIIWKQRIWHPGRGWRKMEDRGDPTQNHMDHPHVLYR